jgi:hypothetical protein
MDKGAYHQLAAKPDTLPLTNEQIKRLARRARIASDQPGRPEYGTASAREQFAERTQWAIHVYRLRKINTKQESAARSKATYRHVQKHVRSLLKELEGLPYEIEFEFGRLVATLREEHSVCARRIEEVESGPNKTDGESASRRNDLARLLCEIALHYSSVLQSDWSRLRDWLEDALRTANVDFPDPLKNPERFNKLMPPRNEDGSVRWWARTCTIDEDGSAIWSPPTQPKVDAGLSLAETHHKSSAELYDKRDPDKFEKDCLS